MSILFPSSSSAKRKRLIKELVQGQDYATQLKFLLHNPVPPQGSLSAKELASNVLRSFAETISVLTSSESDGEVAQNLLVSPKEVAAASSIHPRSEDSTERSKRSTKDRRGSYKRRFFFFLFFHSL